MVINVFAENSTRTETPAEDNTKRNASQIIDSIFKRYRTNSTLSKDKYGINF
jgi:aspartate carbamoyltransferase catalytic subunit